MAALGATWTPDSVEERIATAETVKSLARRAGAKEDEYDSEFVRSAALIEAGRVDEADGALAAGRPAGRRARSSLLSMELRDPRGGQSDPPRTSRRRSPRGPRLIGVGQAGGVGDEVLTTFGAHLYAIRWDQGRLDELIEPVLQFIDELPALLVWRSTLALAYAETGDLDAAREVLDGLAGEGFAFALNSTWMTGMTLAAEAAVTAGATEHANGFYERLAPYAEPRGDRH